MASEMSSLIKLAMALASMAILSATAKENNYYGVFIAELRTREHGVQGKVYAVDSRTIFIKEFRYDGLGPDAFFYVGSSSGGPSGIGSRIPDEKGSKEPLGAYRNKNLVLSLPRGMTLRDVKWFSVWCRAFRVNFGEVFFPDRLLYPQPQKIGALNGEHNVRTDRIIVVDAQTFLIPKFSYDGLAPDANFRAGKGNPKPGGTLIADENGSTKPLGRYLMKTLVLVLPQDMTVFDIDWLSVWCESFFADFAHVRIPEGLNVPPSLKMLGVEPQTKLNCEVLDEEKSFQVRWAIAGRNIVTQLVARLGDREYMSFGLSGDPRKSTMVGGDVAVAWMDQATGQGYADDYHLGAQSQCAGGKGACPDANNSGGRNNIQLLNSAIINDFTMLTYKQPLRASDSYDKVIFTNQSQPVIWAIGPINPKEEVSYHSKRLPENLRLDFGRVPLWNCPLAKGGKGNRKPVQGRPSSKPPKKVKQPWKIPPIRCNEPEDGVFFAQIGPTGGERGYAAITNRVGWGIAWYVNGLLIPEIYVVRGKTYTFVIEGGSDPNKPASYHPFYITDDPEGGYNYKSQRERSSVRVFAGVESIGGRAQPTATGRICKWEEDLDKDVGSSGTFGAYQRALQLNCEEGQPGILQWTPDSNTPDVVYYQCYTHRHLGWKIHVLDSCN